MKLPLRTRKPLTGHVMLLRTRGRRSGLLREAPLGLLREDQLAVEDDLELSAGRVIDAIAKGWVKMKVGQTYPLRDAARAHADLEARKTTGSIVLLP